MKYINFKYTLKFENLFLFKNFFFKFDKNDLKKNFILNYLLF